jgi:hypothetical protein
MKDKIKQETDKQGEEGENATVEQVNVFFV